LLVLLQVVWRRRLPAAADSTCRRMATRTVPCRKGRLAGSQNPDLIPMANWDLDRMMGLGIAAVPVAPAWLAVGLNTAAVPVVPVRLAVSAVCSSAR
jgi:hypothetical protein